MDSFVHLHSHSEYSLLDGAARLTDEKGKPGELLKRISEMKMPALAVTDHGNLYGAIEFYQAARARLNSRGIMAVNLLGRSRGFKASVERIQAAVLAKA